MLECQCGSTDFTDGDESTISTECIIQNFICNSCKTEYDIEFQPTNWGKEVGKV